MKLRVKRQFKYMWDNVTAHKLLPGEYNVPKDLEERTALLAIQFGAAVWVNTPFKKAAPENKVVKAMENKAPAKKKTAKKEKK